ncbi:PPOX class F420-dependent oxidoreductase [Nocardia sp. JMUB6875]|uniref:TIGR03618 family F420-dependent PPOX class oxidoreductase n=1 Tax=Nocardia sp. JMUB6875 TaxID=3158170 RepID=UPI0032E755E7
MTVELDDVARRWLSEPRFWVMGTLNGDGYPQLSPMWAGLEVIDGVERIVIDTSAGRVKEENLRRDPRLSLCCMDEENRYDRMEIRGRAVGFVAGREAVECMDRLAQKYLGTEKFPWLVDGETRVMVVIEPDHIHRTVGVEPFRRSVALG